MKVRSPGLYIFAAAMQLASVFLLTLSPLLNQPAQAADPFKWVYYYPTDQDQPNAVEDMLASFTNMRDGNGNPKDIMKSTYVDIIGGPFGSAPQELDYSSGDTSADNYMAYQLNGGHGYDCYVDGGGNAQLSIPDNAPYWHIDYYIYIHNDPGNPQAPNFEARERISSATKIQGPDPNVQSQGGAGGTRTLVGPVKDHNADGLGHPQIDDQLGIPHACLPDPNYFSHHLSFSPIPSYYQDKADWPNITANPAGNAGGGGGGGSQDVCDAGAVSLGWLLCPIIDLANNTINAVVQDVIVPELNVHPLSTSASDPQYQVWNSIRTLANVLFVLIFIVVIFANTLQFSLDAYTIKKVLPKLVAAAILVQFSYILSALIIDVGNVLGQGIAGLIGNLHGGGGGDVAGTTFASLGGAITIAISAAIIAIIGIPTILLVAVTGVIAVLGVLLTLVARRLIIVLLVITAPIAFAAWVLPNTERYFSAWLKLFIRIALMYPLIMLILSAAKLGNDAVRADGSDIESLLAAILPIVAFFMIPMTFKWAGGAMQFAANGFGKLAYKTNNSGAMKGLRTGARERQQRINQNRASGLQDTVFGRRVPGAQTLMTGLGRVGTGQIYGSRARSNIALATQKAIADESKRLDSLNLNRDVLRAIATNDTGHLTTDADRAAFNAHRSLAGTKTGRAAAANQLAKKSDVEGLELFRQRIAQDTSLDDAQKTQLWNGAKAGAFSDIRKLDPVLAASGWEDSNYTGADLQSSIGRLSGDDIASMHPGRLAEYAANGATLSAGQLAAATEDSKRVGKSAGHQDAILQMTQNGAAATDMDLQREHLIRFDYSTGSAVARSDTQVRDIKRRLAKDPSGPGSYGERLDHAVHSIVTGTPPPGGGPVPTAIPLS